MKFANFLLILFSLFFFAKPAFAQTPDTQAPTGSIVINNDDEATSSTNVIISLDVTDNVD
jgi:hypothetical protein